jgi:hypothetical protein
MVSHPQLHRKSHQVWVANLAIFLFFLVAVPPCAGQSSGTTISGAIASANGAPIPNAVIAVKNLATNEIINLSANVDGS